MNHGSISQQIIRTGAIKLALSNLTLEMWISKALPAITLLIVLFYCARKVRAIPILPCNCSDDLRFITSCPTNQIHLPTFCRLYF